MYEGLLEKSLDGMPKGLTQEFHGGIFVGLPDMTSTNPLGGPRTGIFDRLTRVNAESEARGAGHLSLEVDQKFQFAGPLEVLRPGQLMMSCLQDRFEGHIKDDLMDGSLISSQGKCCL